MSEIIEPIEFLIELFNSNIAEIEIYIAEYVEVQYADHETISSDELRHYLQNQMQEFLTRLKDFYRVLTEEVDELNRETIHELFTETFQPLNVLKKDIDLEEFLSGIAPMSSDPTTFKKIMYRSTAIF